MAAGFRGGEFLGVGTIHVQALRLLLAWVFPVLVTPGAVFLLSVAMVLMKVRSDRDVKSA